MKNFKKIILNNGIPLYLLIDPSLKQFCANYIVKYGSTGELLNFTLNGKEHHVSPGHAHFLEHIITEHSKNGNLSTNLSDRCSASNTYTATDHTSYNFYGIKDFKKSLKELIEAVDIPVFDYRDVNESRKAILEEASTTSDDIKYRLMMLTERNLYGGFEAVDETLSNIGDRETNRRINTRDLRTCYDAFYNDNNKLLVIAGNLNEEEIVDYLNEIYASIPRHESNLILPKYDYRPIRKKEEYALIDVPTEYNTFGLKIEKPEDVSDREIQFVMSILLDYFFADNEFIDGLTKAGIVDDIQEMDLFKFDRFMNIIQGFISSKPDEYFKRVMEAINKKDITREDYELTKKVLLAISVKELDSKYDYLLKFGDRMGYTTDYSEIDFYRSFDYDRFKEIYGKLDFDTHTMVKTIPKQKRD